MLFTFFLALFFFFHSTRASLLNVTIDDTTGDSLTGAHVTYTPADAWKIARNCPQCPDVKDLFSGTAHTSTFSVDDPTHPNVPLTASVSFNGSAIYVFCALSRSSTSPAGNSDMTFYMDGVEVGAFVLPALGSAGFDYSVPVYVNSALPPGQHTFTLQNGHQDGASALAILDSIIYTREDSSADAPAPSAEPAAATTQGGHGTTVAVVITLVVALLLLLIALGVFLYRRRRHRRAIYARYMPEGTVRAFPPSRPSSFVRTATPASFSRTHTPAGSIAALPPAYSGGGATGGANWWVGRDQKTRGTGPTHRPYADLDPGQAGLQRPQGWEHTHTRSFEF
ncbi:hypothetical protein C8R46DRAFT_1122167 [Mycena filopes]|nr:hypothetical protein C8R46DRAFT_1122167 [Mycena filopes]